VLASGWSAVYPCHVPPREMRTHPIGTGPFKFVEFKPNELIRVTKNPGYWKPGRPYLDGIDYTIRGRRPADHFLRPPGDLLAAPAEGADDHGQQHLQWRPHGRPLTR
jgi:MarR-like DNA-binding transcriptional regulator SgrR of sgrS sRNA